MKKLPTLTPALKGLSVLGALVLCQTPGQWPIVAFAVCWLLHSSLAAAMDRLSSIEVKGRFRPRDRR